MLRRLHVHPRSLILVLALLGATASCETSSDPILGVGGGGATLTATQASGTWNITVTRTTNLNCSGALASGQVITAHLSVLSDGTVTTPSNWQNPLTGALQTLSGTVNLTTGALDLVLGSGVSQAMELFPGNITAGGAINGATLTDPAAGFSQVFGTDGCQYSATGTKTGG
jgi:hypothetical protein